MPLSDFNYETWIVKSRLNRELEILDSMVAVTDGKIVLDAGSGADGHYVKEYLNRGLKTIMMDISPDNLETARKNHNYDGAYLLAGDINNIPLAAESVDILFFCEVLEHLNAPEQALKEACRVLKKGGYIFLDVPWLHEVYRPLSAIVLRNFSSFKRTGKPTSLLKLIYTNLGEIDRHTDSATIQRTVLGSLVVDFARLFPTFRSVDPECFVHNYYNGTVPEGNMHLQFRLPKEWATAISQAGFELVKKTGAFITPPLFCRSRLCNLLSNKLERSMADNLLFRFSQILIIVAAKT